MLYAGLGGGQQVEVLPDPDELSLENLADQDDWHFDPCAGRWPMSRRWPFVGDDCGMQIFPAEFRSLRIGENVCGFDAKAPSMLPRGNGSYRQLLDFIEPAEGFTGGHDHPLAVWIDELVEAFDVIGGECGRERLDKVGLVLTRNGSLRSGLESRVHSDTFALHLIVSCI